MSLVEYSEFKIAEKIDTIYPPILLTVGLAGNVLSIVVLSQANNRKTSTGVMLIVLSLTDILILITSVFVNWLVYVSEFDFRNSSTVACKLHVFLSYLLLQLSAWILVCITVERVFSVLYPHKVKDVFRRRRVLVAMVILVLSLVGLNSHILYGVQLDAESQRCLVTVEHKHFMFKIWTWIDFAFAFAIPFCVLLIGNVVVVTKLKSSNHFRTRNTTVIEDTGHSNRRTVRRETRTTHYFTVTALILNIAFAVFVSPFVIFAIGQPYWFSEESMTLQRHADLILIGAVTKMLMYVNNGINFILYILCGSKFRKDFVKVVCCTSTRHRFMSDSMWSNRTVNSLSNISMSSHMTNS